MQIIRKVEGIYMYLRWVCYPLVYCHNKPWRIVRIATPEVDPLESMQSID